MIERLRALNSLGRYSEVLKLSNELLQKEESSAIYAEMLIALLNQEKSKEALEAAKQSLSLHPNDPYLLYLLSESLRRLQRPKEALSALDEALALSPSSGALHHQRAKIFCDLNQYVQAKRAIDSALSLESDDPDILCTLAFITHALDNTLIACEILQSILARHPHHEQALKLYGLWGESRLDRYAQTLRGILAQNPLDSFANRYYRQIHRYYRLAPLLAGVYLLYALGTWLEIWKIPEPFPILALWGVSAYLWRDWRLNLPFLLLALLLLSPPKSLADGFSIFFAAILYHFIGKAIEILLYGPPGCGKSYFARAIVGECGATFFNVGIDQILDMYVGNSEKTSNTSSKAHAMLSPPFSL